MAAQHNGEWPELPRVPPPIEPLPERPGVLQLAQTMGTTLVMFGSLWPRIVQAVEYLRRGQERIEAWMERHDQVHQQPPPMRPQLESNSDLARVVGADVAAQYEADARNPATPPPNRHTVAALVEQRVAAELLKVRQAYAVRLEEERRAADAKQAETEKHRAELVKANSIEAIKAKWAIRVAMIVIVVTGVAKVVESVVAAHAR